MTDEEIDVLRGRYLRSGTPDYCIEGAADDVRDLLRHIDETAAPKDRTETPLVEVRDGHVTRVSTVNGRIVSMVGDLVSSLRHADGSAVEIGDDASDMSVAPFSCDSGMVIQGKII